MSPLLTLHHPSRNNQNIGRSQELTFGNLMFSEEVEVKALVEVLEGVEKVRFL